MQSALHSPWREDAVSRDENIAMKKRSEKNPARTCLYTRRSGE
jgi:hypothetical protein